jgi:hypothetical protein
MPMTHTSFHQTLDPLTSAGIRSRKKSTSTQFHLMFDRPSISDIDPRYA